MRINDDQPRMHGNPPMRGEHDRHGDGGLSQWGHRGRANDGYGNPPRFDQHGGQTGEGWHSADDGGLGRSTAAMGGNQRYDRYGQEDMGTGHGYQGGSYGGTRGGQFGQDSRGFYGDRFGQGDDRHSRDASYPANQASDSHPDRARQGHGFDQHRYGQQGLGTWNSHDHQYRNWRDQQLQAFDRDYEEFRRHRQERFHADFDEWRKSRGGSAPGGLGQGQQISTTQRSTGGSDENR